MENRLYLLVREDQWSVMGWDRSPIAKVDLGSFDKLDFQNVFSSLKASEKLNSIDDFFMDYKDSMLFHLMELAGLSYRDLIFSIILKKFNKDALLNDGKIILAEDEGYDILLWVEKEEEK